MRPRPVSLDEKGRGNGPSAKGREEWQIGRTLTGTHGGDKIVKPQFFDSVRGRAKVDGLERAKLDRIMVGKVAMDSVCD